MFQKVGGEDVLYFHTLRDGQKLLMEFVVWGSVTFTFTFYFCLTDAEVNFATQILFRRFNTTFFKIYWTCLEIRLLVDILPNFLIVYTEVFCHRRTMWLRLHLLYGFKYWLSDIILLRHMAGWLLLCDIWPHAIYLRAPL